MPDTPMPVTPAAGRTVAPRKAMPTGLNHLVLNVRDMAESHRFYTEVVGLAQVGQLTPTTERPNPPNMRFYSADHGNGRLSHHDLALVETKTLPEPGGPAAIAHVAFAFPDRETWLSHLAHLQAIGVPFDRRVEHGMTHSLYIRDPNGYGVELLYELPRESWEGDIAGALNYLKPLPTEGAAALEDRTEGLPDFSGR